MNYRKTYSFASMAFANSVPFTEYFASVCPQCKVVYDPPSKLSDLLLSGAVDAALIPVADLFLNSSLKQLGNIGICATGATTSTLLKCRKPLPEVSCVLKDRSSKTSNALARVLFKEHFNLNVKMLAAPCKNLVDAEIIIGDPALQSKPALCCDYDLSEEWFNMTGKPFVFAVWASMHTCQYCSELLQILEASLDQGIRNIDAIAKAQASRLELPVPLLEKYFSSIIRYRLEKSDVKGMNLFRQKFGELMGDFDDRS